MGLEVADKSDDIELKFDGDPVKRLNGAPAEAVISSLCALQRMIYIIGMRSEGRSLSERLKPTAKVKREYAIVCRAPKHGSHIQPFNVASQAGVFTPAAVSARDKLIKTLKAFDSGQEKSVEEVLPNSRERWFMARAALGLLPSEDSGLEITVRSGSRGPFNFKAERARALLSKYETGSPPEVEEEIVAGKLWSIDFVRTILTIKPSGNPAIRMDYPFPLEDWLQANRRRRLQLVGKPKFSQRGDITSFQELRFVVELEPTLDSISEFQSNDRSIRAVRPLSIPVTVDWKDRMFTFNDKELGLNAYSSSYNEMRAAILEDLDVIWRQYALAPIEDLDAEAQLVKKNLLERFRA